MDSEFRYSVYAYSGFHLMGDAEKYLLGEFGDCSSAIEACEKIIDDFLLSVRESASSTEARLDPHERSAPEPYIETNDPGCRFFAAEYVRRRIRSSSLSSSPQQPIEPRRSAVPPGTLQELGVDAGGASRNSKKPS